MPGDHDEQELRHLAETTIIVLGEWRRGVIDFMNFTNSLADIDSDDTENADDSDSDDSGDGFPIDMMDVGGILGEVTKRARPAAGTFANMMPDAVRKPKSRCHMSVQMREELDRRKRRKKRNKTTRRVNEANRLARMTHAARQARLDKDFDVLNNKIKILDFAHANLIPLLPPDHNLPLPLTPGIAKLLQIKAHAVFSMYETIVGTKDEGYSLDACAKVAAADSASHGVSFRSVLKWELEFRTNGGYFHGSAKGHYNRMVLIDEPEMKKRANKFIKRRSQPRGKPNMSVADFTDYINGTNLTGTNNPVAPPGRRVKGPKKKVIPSIFDGYSCEEKVVLLKEVCRPRLCPPLRRCAASSL